MGILNDELNRIHHEMAKIAAKYFGEGETMPTTKEVDESRSPSKVFFTYDIDAVEVVRCKNCQYYYEQPRGFSPICELTRSRAEKEGFCSWGKKKDE